MEEVALSLMFGIWKFHWYLYGCHFTLETDHKPLMTIFGPKKGVPAMAAARLQHWGIQLGFYHYTIKFWSIQEHANAGGLSRLPFWRWKTWVIMVMIVAFSQIENLSVTAKTSRKGVILSKVLHFVKFGWPSQVEVDLKSFYQRRNELSCEAGCVLWGTRTVIPQKLRFQLLIKELHWKHPGMMRMK